MLILLDYFFTVFHAVFILFVVFGWYHEKTKKAHFTALLLTLAAWLLLGLYKGVLGYCPLTDWHWDVKRALGERGMPSSFVEYLLEKLTGIKFSRRLVDGATVAGLIFGIVMAFVKSRKVKVLSPKEKQAA